MTASPYLHRNSWLLLLFVLTALKINIFFSCIQDLSQPIVNYETDISNVTASPTYTETAGSPFRLHVLVSRLADATGEITYQWYKLNAAESSIPVAVADGGKSAVLRIGSVKIGDEGSYFCVARLKNSVRKSDSIILTVNCKNLIYFTTYLL